MKRMMIASDWTHGLLYGTVSGDNNNLDDPRNVDLLNRLVARYDIFMFGWYALPVRTRLRQIAAQQGRHIEIYKYLDPLGWRPSDSTGYMALTPSSRMVISADGQTCYKPEWCLRDSAGVPLRAAPVEESGFLVDPTGPGLLDAAKSHILELVDGFDGIWMDLLAPTYYNEIGDKASAGDYRWPLNEWNSIPGYAEEKLALHSALADHLAKYGKKCMHNTPSYWHNGQFWPRYAAGDSRHNITFSENFATSWDSIPATINTPSYGQWLAPSLDYMDWCTAHGREVAMQFLSNDAATIPYGYELFLQAAGPTTAFLGCAMSPEQLYSLEPTEIPDYALKLGSPIGRRTETNGVLTRKFEHGLVIANWSSSAQTVTLPGAYRNIGATTVLPTSVTVQSAQGLVLASGSPTTMTATSTLRIGNTTPSAVYTGGVRVWPT